MSETTEAPVAVEQEPRTLGDSLRDVIGDAYEEAERRQEEAQSAHARDDNGRFAKPADEPVAETPVEPAPPAAPDVDRPDAWAADQWDSLTPDARRYAAAREQAIRTELENRELAAQEAERFKAVAAPHADRFRQMGLTPEQAFERLMTWENALRTEPQAALPQIARALGIDLRSLIPDPNTQQFQQQQVLHDPRVDAIIAREQAEQRRQEAENQALAQREQAKIDAEIAAFRSNPSVEHFEQLRPVMAGLMGFAGAMPLQEAYERARWAAPEHRAVLLEQIKKQAVEEYRKNEATKVAQAKARHVSVRDSSGTSPWGQAGALKPMRDDLESVWNQLT